MDEVSDSSRNEGQASQEYVGSASERIETEGRELHQAGGDNGSRGLEASSSSAPGPSFSVDMAAAFSDGSGSSGSRAAAAGQLTGAEAAEAVDMIEIPPVVELPIMTQALSRAVVAAARRNIQAAEKIATPESAVFEACVRCCRALEDKPDTVSRNLHQAGQELSMILHSTDCPSEVWELTQQSCTLINQVQMVQMYPFRVELASNLFSALFHAARIALHRAEASVGLAAAPQGFSHCLALLSTAEAAAFHNVESVAHVVDALLALRETVPQESESLRRASIIIEDSVVLRCCCSVGHRSRDALVERLARAFNRPLDKLEERLLNSYRKNVFGLQGAFTSNSQVQRRNRPKKKRGVKGANSQSPKPDEQQDGENSSGSTSGDRSQSDSQPSNSDEQQDMENSFCSTPNDGSQPSSSSDACAAEEVVTEMGSHLSSCETSVDLPENIKMPFPVRVQVNALLKAILDDNVLLENRIECVRALEQLLLSHAQEQFGPDLVSSVSASLLSVLRDIGSSDRDGFRGAVAHTILLGSWEVELFDEALSQMHDALLKQLELIMFASSTDSENPVLEHVRAGLEAIATQVPSFAEGDLRRNIAAWVQRGVWQDKVEQCKVLLWRRFTLVGLLFGVQGTVCDILSTTEDVYFLEAGYNSLTSVLQAKARSAPLSDTDINRCVRLILDVNPPLERTMAAGTRTLALLMHGAVASAERGEEDAFPMKVALKAAARAMSLARRCGAHKTDKPLRYEFAPLVNSALRTLHSLFAGAESLKNLRDMVSMFAEQVMRDYEHPEPFYPERQQVVDQFPGSEAARFLQEQHEVNEEGRLGAIQYATQLIEEHGLRDYQPVPAVGEQADSK
mmetsp:Transcript_7158/g.17845  ORF Transcript_7158/g.17845 Transcript_7158/m.17845 type:complete len:853 (+) Transcript_7158:40-2598(+)|eukprot:CAMPEP_0115382666 /NCGR_PEP_ID=MMETSP0271-20121206/6200_1 /TAXON_ID=71861 /ORGANISM="Scrippsiella trochoidea, Strain CCMP3099" /LENGTH=852 /DNA_ID=CAMNT_0002805977 /DNA_START=40 /DNA_END=2598 /DNA_ORIENTATION=-